MADGLMWTTNAKGQKVAPFDPNATRIIPFSWVAFLAGIGAAYDSHEFIVDAPLEEVSSVESSGIISLMVRVIPADIALAKIGKDFKVTCRITADNGEIQDETRYLKMTNQ